MYDLHLKGMVHGGCVFIFVPSTTLWLRFEDESFRGRGGGGGGGGGWGRDDENQSTMNMLQMSIGPITRARTENLQE